MSTMDTTKTVRDFAVEIPGATRLFETIGIDYCCGGGKTLAEACAASGLDASAVAASLEGLGIEPDSRQHDSLTELADFIESTHHTFTRTEIARINALLAKVIDAHGERHPELREIRNAFAALATELGPHLMKEEQVLFPYIRQLEQAAKAGSPAPMAFFGTVRNPVAMMSREHDGAGVILANLRELTDGYTTPEDGCFTFKTLYEALEGLERDLHQHIHLENNVLFPAAIELEAQR
jgi:regulator of cell morphogenesis and NO signaling